MTADSKELSRALEATEDAGHARDWANYFANMLIEPNHSLTKLLGRLADNSDALPALLSTNEALARENERLREALKPFANAVGLGGYDDQVVVELSSGTLTRGQFRTARQALEPSHAGASDV